MSCFWTATFPIIPTSSSAVTRALRPNAGGLVICIDTKHAQCTASAATITEERPRSLLRQRRTGLDRQMRQRHVDVIRRRAHGIGGRRYQAPRNPGVSDERDDRTVLSERTDVWCGATDRCAAGMRRPTAFSLRILASRRLPKTKEFRAAVSEDAPDDKPDAGGSGGPRPQIDVLGSSDAEHKGTIFSGKSSTRGSCFSFACCHRRRRLGNPNHRPR